MRRKWVYRPGDPDADATGFVEITAEVVEKRALDAGVLSGRFYENVSATDGTDIGSRKKHAEYMKRNNLALADDFKDTWARREQAREEIFTHNRLPDKSRRDDIGRALHRLYKP